MNLKRLTLSGFKSFADKVTLHFDRGVTGIVGPNGCGKSNVIDAVRWVMGEQNAKHLRGEQATDIIFSGSEKRKGLGLAEVSLTFDNSEQNSFCPPEYRHESEITITRRLYIDGQREYFINRKPCRLKDVVDFFTSTGLGGRGYSMIQQGQVDRILNAKPEDVREILEEAAGTLIYRKRKIEALKKLEAAQLNLSRVEDILIELQRHKESLSEQVKKAQMWQELSKQLKNDEIKMLSHNYRHFSDEYNKIDADIGSALAQEASLTREMADVEDRQAELQEILDREAPRLQVLREEIAQLREDIARKESAIVNLLNKRESNEKYLTQLQGQLSEADESFQRLSTQKTEADFKYNEASRLVAGIDQLIGTLQDELDSIDTGYNSYEDKKNELEEQLKTLNRLQDNNSLRKESLQKDAARSQREQADLYDRILLLQDDVKEAQIWLQEAEAKVTAEKAGLDKELKEKHFLDAEIANKLDQLTDLKSAEDSSKELFFQCKAKLDSLVESELSDTKLREHTLALAKQSGLKLPILSDLIEIDDKSGVLGQKAIFAVDSLLSSLLIKSNADLNKIQQSNSDLGFSFSAFVSSSDSNQDENNPAIEWAEKSDLIPISDFIRIRPEASDTSGLIRVLSRIFFSENSNLDDSFLKTIPADCKIITKTGFIFSASSSLVFHRGSADVRGSLSREAEITTLSKKLEDITVKLAMDKLQVQRINKEVDDCREKVSRIDDVLANQNRQVLELLGDMQSCQHTFEHKKHLLKTAEFDLGEKKKIEEADKLELIKLSEALNSIELEQEQTHAELISLRSQYEGQEERRNEIMRQIKSKEIEQAALISSLSAHKESLDRIEQELNLVRARQEKRRGEVTAAQNELANFEQDYATNQAAIETLVHAKENKDADLISQQEGHASVIEELKVIDNKLREIRDLQNKNQRSFADKKIHMERARIAIDSAISQAEQDHHLDLRTFEFELDPDFDQQKLSKVITQTRAAIEGLGAINMMAIDEFEELVTRENFISEQRDEVLASINLLSDAIDEIAVTSEKKYLSTFHAVNAEFSQLFPVLFPRGEAHLILTDEEKPLEGGIEIMVRLPGKKHQRLKLFSGGEKALTAISLIFALLKTKPTPFCFLDEVDAPLDEANVGRFNRVLDALSSRFQFVIITHNRRTMEILDTLYGVTMQEPGVSKVVGVDMQKDIPAHLRKNQQAETPSETQSLS